MTLAIDWTREMGQTFEFREVDPATWQDVGALDQVTSMEVTCDSEAELGGSAVLELRENIGERYVRAYLVATQDGRAERHAVGTVLAQAGQFDYDGTGTDWRAEGYPPLIELADDMPDLGYWTDEGRDAVEAAGDMAALHCRAPVIRGSGRCALSEPFEAEPDETWLDHISALLERAGYYPLCDELGQVLMMPERDPSAMAPAWTFDDSNASIVQPGISGSHDLYEVPNAVEVVYASDGFSVSARAVNDDPGSAASTVSRGRVKLDRDTAPEAPDGMTAAQAQAWVDAEARRRADIAACEHELTFTHGFVPGVRVGDCVQLDFRGAGVRARALVVAQTVACETGGQVTSRVKWKEAMG